MNPFKRQAESDAAETYLRSTQLLLQAIGAHSIEGEPEEHRSFRSTIEQLEAKINGKAPSTDCLVAVGAATKAMHDYSRRTNQFIKVQNVALQKTVQMLIDVLVDLAPAPAANLIAGLRGIESQIAKATSTEDIQTLKKRVEKSLESFRVEIARFRENPVSAVPVAAEEPSASAVEERSVPEEPVQPPDTLTGLPVRSSATAAIRECKRSGKRSFAAIFAVNQLQYIQSRFGRSIADEVLVLFLKRLEKHVSPTDRLFRWGQTSLVALLDRPGLEFEVRQEIERAMFRRVTETFTVNDRPVMLTISATWNIVPVEGATCEAVAANLDSFVTQNT